MLRKSSNKKDVGGIPAKKIVIPIILVLTFLHISIIATIMMVNKTSSELSSIMQKSGEYVSDATSLLAGSSLLSETSSNFILMPVAETGEVIIMPLQAYAGELANDRRGAQVAERFKSYDVSPEVKEAISQAAESAEFMMESQLKAISLMSAVYPYPDIMPLRNIPVAELTEEEQSMSSAQKESSARLLLLGSVYALHKQTVSQQVNTAVGMIQAASGARAAAAQQRIAKLRSSLWAITGSIIVILSATFICLHTQLLAPLDAFVHLISSSSPLDDTKGLNEVRQVANAYNTLLKRRDALDAILRSAAETDALTNMPNRYRFEQYMLESGESGYSLAVLLFDINYLKKTNDTYGHLAGDKLIRDAASCISSCFGENCFRFGGDEFAAVVKDCTPEMVQEMIERFKVAEQEKNVSISLGYAFTEEIGNTTLRSLLDEADKKMYIQKENAHRLN